MSATTESPLFLLCLEQPDGPPPAPGDLDRIMAAVAALNDDLRAAGAWVLTAGLAPAQQAWVARAGATGTVVTDGPFAEAREHVGGFWVIRCAGPDEAIRWAGRASAATSLPVEVRPVTFLG